MVLKLLISNAMPPLPESKDSQYSKWSLSVETSKKKLVEHTTVSSVTVILGLQLMFIICLFITYF